MEILKLGHPLVFTVLLAWWDTFCILRKWDTEKSGQDWFTFFPSHSCFKQCGLISKLFWKQRKKSLGMGQGGWEGDEWTTRDLEDAVRNLGKGSNGFLKLFWNTTSSPPNAYGSFTPLCLIKQDETIQNKTLGSYLLSLMPCICNHASRRNVLCRLRLRFDFSKWQKTLFS